MNTKDYEYDITWDYREKEHKVYLDLGEEAVTLSRSELLDMLKLLDEADASL